MYSQRKEGVSEPHLAVLVNCKRQLRTTGVPMISAARMDTEGHIRGSILKGDSDMETGQRPGLFDSEEQQLFHLAQQRKSVDSLYEHLQVCDVLPLSTKS